MKAEVQTHKIHVRFVVGKVTLRQFPCLSNMVLLVLKFHQLGPGVTGTFLITNQKSSSSYTYKKKELCEGNITYTCNVSNWLYC